jgi:4-amino-4-deoxy-L-arabinose transferase-like glycosyltransferase
MNVRAGPQRNARPASALFFAVAVGAAAGGILISTFSPAFHPLQADETVLALGAKQLLDGSVLYRDFYVHVPPFGFYLIAGWFSLFGASLAALRILSILVMVAGTIVLFAAMRRGGAPNAWAAIAALTFAGISVAVWPVPSHHYFALVLGFAALLTVAGARPSPVQWLFAGILVGLSGLTLQTEGVIFVTLLAARLAVAADGRRRATVTLAATGLFIPFVAFVGLFLWQGALGDAAFNIVTWPTRYYKQPGGFNDTIGEGFRGLQIARAGTRVNPMQLLSAYWILGAPVLLGAWLIGDVWKHRRDASGRTERLGGLISTLVVWIVFMRGRIDSIHLIAFCIPVFVYLLMTGKRWSERGPLPRVVKGWLVVCLALIVVQWGRRWRTDPPDIDAVLAIDGMVKRDRVEPIIDDLPGVRSAGLPILLLSHEATAFYFYWGPVVPAATWLLRSAP